MIEYNKNMLVGAKITNVRKMVKSELDAHYWGGCDPVYIIELDNGSAIYPSADFEGNSGGVLYGVTRDEECFNVCERNVTDTSHLNNDDFGAFIRGEMTKEEVEAKKS